MVGGALAHYEKNNSLLCAIRCYMAGQIQEGTPHSIHEVSLTPRYGGSRIEFDLQRSASSEVMRLCQRQTGGVGMVFQTLRRYTCLRSLRLHAQVRLQMLKERAGVLCPCTAGVDLDDHLFAHGKDGTWYVAYLISSRLLKPFAL